MSLLLKCYRMPPLLLGLLVLAAFLPVLIFTYGRLDDMALAYWFARDFNGTMRDIFIAQGRPILGVFLGLLLYPVSTFGDLVWLRLLAVFLTWILALQIHRFLISRSVGYGASLAFALIMVANPGMAALNGWAICCTHILGFIIAFAIGTRAVRRMAEEDRLANFCTAFSTSIMLLLALFIYQPAAAFVLLPPCMAWLLDGRTAAGRERLIWILAAYVASLGLYFIGVKVVVDFWLQIDAQSDRSALVSDLGAKWAFLMEEPLQLLGLSWAWFFGSTLRTCALFLTLGTLVGGILHWVRRSGWLGVADAALVGFLLVAGLISLIVLQINYAPFRVLTFGYSLVAFLVALGLSRAWPGRRGRIMGALGNAGMIVAVAGILILNHLFLRIGMGEPFEREYLHYRQALQQQIGDALPISVLWAIPDHFDLKGTIALPRIRYEFGTLSSAMEYTVAGMNWMLLSEIEDIRSRSNPRWGDLLKVEAVPLREDRMWTIPSGIPFLDGPALFTGQPAQPAASMQAPWEHPGLGQIENLYNGWNYKPGFGIFNSWIPQGVFHAERGIIDPLTGAPLPE